MVQPAWLGGLPFGDWARLLWQHRREIDAAFIPRILATTPKTLITSVARRFEPGVELTREERTLWERPIFVLGLARSGTTYLFDLLASHPGLCCPTRFDVFNPHAFLILRRLGLARLLSLIPAQRRAMDNVKIHWLSPEEEWAATTILSGGWGDWHVLPRTWAAGPSNLADDVARDTDYPDAVRAFTRKLVRCHARPVLLKSPQNTARVATILRTFPDARFVTVFRDPEAQWQSFRGMQRSDTRLRGALQWPPPVDATLEKGLAGIQRTLKNYFRDREMIPGSQLKEIRYEDLVASERAILAELCGWLGLEPVPTRIAPQPGGSPTYVRNRHEPLDQALRERLKTVFAPLYERGLYAPPG